MEALTIDEIISAKKNFLNIDKDLNHKYIIDIRCFR